MATNMSLVMQIVDTMQVNKVHRSLPMRRSNLKQLNATPLGRLIF